MTSVNIALPSMQRDLHIRPSNLQWIGECRFLSCLGYVANYFTVSAYALAFGGFLLLAGVIADRYTKRIVFCGGMGLLAVASLACGLAQTEIHLIVCRAIQGLGAAATVPSAIGVLSTYFSGKDRHRALSSFGAAGAVGFSVGLVLGGLVTGTIGWVRSRSFFCYVHC
jgi:MFS family permease